MIAGKWTGTMNLTEPQAGSDLNAVRTRAERAEDGSYRLFGQKIFITYGEHDMAENIVHLVLARLPGAPAGTRGLSLFLAPKFLVNADGSLGARNDLRCASIEHKLGIHGSPTCVMVYGDEQGAQAWLIGEENRGLAAMFVMMNAARLAVGTQGVAIGDRAYQQALSYARERRQGRSAKGDGMSPIIEHADVQRMLMTMKANVHAARGICHLTGAALDLADHAPTEAERTAAANRAALSDPDRQGASRPISATRRPRSASRSMAAWASSRRPAPPSTCAIPGSRRSTKARTASMASISCSASCRSPAARPCAPRSPKSARRRATSRPGAARASARRRSGSPRLRTRSRNRRGSRSTGWRPDQNSALAGASQYLRLFGLTLGGACLAKAGLAAEALAAGGDESELGRVGLARFFAEKLMTAAPGLARAIASGDAPLEPYEAILAETA